MIYSLLVDLMDEGESRIWSVLVMTNTSYVFKDQVVNIGRLPHPCEFLSCCFVYYVCSSQFHFRFSRSFGHKLLFFMVVLIIEGVGSFFCNY